MRALLLLLIALPGLAAARDGDVRKPGTKVLPPAVKPSIGPATGPLGRLGGDGWQQGWIEAGAELKVEQQFLAGQPAAVSVLSQAGAPLAVTVAERDEAPVCRRARGCRWQPAFTGRYAITLTNAGRARVRYVLVVR